MRGQNVYSIFPNKYILLCTQIYIMHFQHNVNVKNFKKHQQLSLN